MIYNPIKPEQYALLLPYTNGMCDDLGEISMYCPRHEDTNASASVNVCGSVWNCQACPGGGSIRQLCDSPETWEPLEGRQIVRTKTKRRPSTGIHDLPSELQVQAWRQNLAANREARGWLLRQRGITFSTAKRASLGLNGHVKIPIFDDERKLLNIRTYDPKPVGSRRKMWSIKGRGEPHLYPISMLMSAEPGDKVLFCEGEWDALLAIQNGVRAITRTAAARSNWREEWNDWFEDLEVYLCHDADWAGQEGNSIVGLGICDVVQGLLQCQLPYQTEVRGGKDVSDLILERGIDAVHSMMTKAERLV